MRNIMMALTEPHHAPEHHRVKPQPVAMHHALHVLHGQQGHSYCQQCGAIGFQKRWYVDPVQEAILRKGESGSGVLCPGCARVEQQIFEGEVVMSNSRCATALGEMISLIKHVEGKAWHNNPLARLSAFTDGETIHIQTTTRSLAERIGKELHKAFKGNLEIKRAPGEHFVRVYWTD
jgi:NMD protein affecting ribosome stability and mRNA decay